MLNIGQRSPLIRALINKSISSRNSLMLQNRAAFMSDRSIRNSYQYNKNNKSSATSSTSSKNKQVAVYEDLIKGSQGYQKSMNNLLNMKDVVYKNDEEKKSEYVKEITNLTEQYNTMYNRMQEAGGAINIAQSRSMKTILTTHSKELEEVGITLNDKGNLIVDEKKLKESDTKKLQTLFSDEKGFLTQITDKAVIAAKNATTVLSALMPAYGNLNYNKYGTTQNSAYYEYLYNKYNNVV